MGSDDFSYGCTVEFYDYIVPYHARKDIDFFIGMAEETGGPILELACGTGRVLIPTARKDFEITGLELDGEMLAICREKLENEPEEVQARVSLVKEDMRDFELPGTFSLITTPFRPFQHLETVGEQVACLESIHRHLSDDGKLVLDLFNPSMVILTDESRQEEFGEEDEFTMPDGRRVLRRCRVPSVDKAKQLINCEFIYYITHPDGSKEQRVDSFRMRYLFRYEVEHLLSRCGFTIEAVYGDYDRSPYGSTWPGELIFIASKT